MTREVTATIVFYISGHGLGHVSRELDLIRALTSLRPDLRVVVRTAAAPWMFEPHPEIQLQPVEVDTGVAQVDSLRLDPTETAVRAARFYRDFDRRADEEAAVVDALGASAVVGDIPPLAFTAAARAGVRSIAVGNFTWDWIYRAYEEFHTVAPGVIDKITDAYAEAEVALRLPMHGGFGPMADVTTDIPFIARRSQHDPAEIRRHLHVPDDVTLVLSSFGGYGLDIAPERIAAEEGLTILAFNRHPPAGLAYPDLVAAADVVVSKPGYGIISECIANDTALVFTSRGAFAEYDVLVKEMPKALRCQYLPMTDLLAGRWAGAVRAALQQPRPAARPRIDGADVAAAAILAATA